MEQQTAKRLTVAVVVCTRDRPQQLQACLDSVAQLRPLPDQVLVVDSASTSAQVVRNVADRAGASYLREEQPGLSRARNLAARYSTSDVLVFIDDDGTCDPRLLAAYSACFQDGSIGAVAGAVHIAGRTYSHSVGFSIAKPAAEWFSLTNFGGVGNGGNIAVRREALLQVGGFDERLGRGMALDGSEEHNLFFRLADAGWTITTEPQAIIQHPSLDPAKAHERVLHDIRNASAYMTLLLWEFPRHRRELLRYIRSVLRRRATLQSGYSRLPIALPWWRKALAAISGPLLYIRHVRGQLGARVPALSGSIPQQ